MISAISNTAASAVAKNLASNARDLEKSQERLSSGSKISTSSDDPAGLAVSLKLSAQQHSLDAYETVLSGASSFVEMQSDALSRVASVLQRLGELETLKMDPTKSLVDRGSYEGETANLNAELVKIGEEKYNGIRLFAPGLSEDFLNLDTTVLDKGNLPLVRPPLKGSTSTEVFPNPLDVVFLIDLTGSMGSTIARLKTSIDSFFDNLPASVGSWRARIVGYRDEDEASPPAFVETGDFVSTKADVLVQLNDPKIYADGGGDEPETLEDALYKVSQKSSWSPSADVKRYVIAFTDATPKEPPKVASRTAIINELRSKGIDLTICGRDENTTRNFVTDSGAKFENYEDVLKNMDIFLTKFAERSATTTVIAKGLTLDETASYIARKGAEGSVISVLKDQRFYIRNNLESAISKIRDTDVAAEMGAMIRRKVLVDSGAAMLQKANDSMRIIVSMIESARIQ